MGGVGVIVTLPFFPFLAGFGLAVPVLILAEALPAAGGLVVTAVVVSAGLLIEVSVAGTVVVEVEVLVSVVAVELSFVSLLLQLKAAMLKIEAAPSNFKEKTLLRFI